MPTLHLQTETAYFTSRSLMQAGLAMDSEIAALYRALSQLDEIWQGSTQEKFTTQAEKLAQRLRTQNEFILELASRLERETQEWESADQFNMASWQQGIDGRVAWGAILPTSAGNGSANISFISVLPMTVAVSLGRLLSGVPVWLESTFASLFPQPMPLPTQSVSRTSQGSLHQKKTALGELLEETAPNISAPSKTQTKKASSYIGDYDVPIKSQGMLYGSAACTPTSVSMVLDYFHHQDSKNQTASPQRLIDIMDTGDGTYGKGISISNLTDELNSLGYHHISQKVNANIVNLKNALVEGPVVVVAGVRITSGGAERALAGPGTTMHAMVVRGISESNVLINDPWSGTKMEIPMRDFTQMWQRGSNSYYAILP